MSKNLIIVESPAKARTISKFLGLDYTVTASMGHVRDLPERDLGFDPARNFEPQYQISKDKEKTIKALRQAIRPDTTVFLATDEDREGESISWHLIAALGLDDRPVQRIVFHEITKSAILNALRNPREVDQKLVDAQQARRILDRAVGYELSPLLWRKVKPGLSAGRVQSVAVRIIVDREREIRKFVPEEYWRLKAQFPGFETELAKLNGKTAKVPNETTAQAIENSVHSGEWTVQSVTEKEAQRQPYPPFTTSTLQQEASVKLGFAVKRTMSVAQQLYEGNFEIPGYSGGLITYMRTDSVTLSEDSLKQAQQVVTQEFGAKFALPTPRRFRNRSKNAQEAHEAIRPVDLSKTPAKVRGFLKGEQARLYELIWRRMMAGQMAAANFARTVVQIEAGVRRECLFEAKGQRILFPGFLRAYVRDGEAPGAVLGEKDVILPHVEQGQTLKLEGFSKEQLFTKPLVRYTEATLVKKLESEGIGRPSTYAPTISTIQDRQYVEKRKVDGRLQPTDIGEVVNDFLANHFEEIVNLGFTAKIERQFDRIAQGDEDWISMLGGFYFPFHQRIEEKGQSV
ncbi:MAG TPA: type I DNA topoisomerase, partial [Deltaproteobacteria bacterium]|nr:type I DNA topoisomerase [Deltaproteobacteria bacterium]